MTSPRATTSAVLAAALVLAACAVDVDEDPPEPDVATTAAQDFLDRVDAPEGWEEFPLEVDQQGDNTTLPERSEGGRAFDPGTDVASAAAEGRPLAEELGLDLPEGLCGDNDACFYGDRVDDGFDVLFQIQAEGDATVVYVTADEA